MLLLSPLLEALFYISSLLLLILISGRSKFEFYSMEFSENDLHSSIMKLKKYTYCQILKVIIKLKKYKIEFFSSKISFYRYDFKNHLL